MAGDAGAGLAGSDHDGVERDRVGHVIIVAPGGIMGVRYRASVAIVRQEGTVNETFAALPTTADAAVGGSRPIASYGLLSDCNTAALVGSDGSIDWFCVPRFDGPAVFARLLDPDAGHWSIRPAGEFTTERRYLPNSLVLETTFTTETGVVRLLDALALADGQRGHDLGLDAPRELLRSVDGVSGTVDLVLELAPRPEYGLVRPLFRQTDDGGRTFGGPNQIVVRAGVPGDRATARCAPHSPSPQGDEIGFSLRWSPVESTGREPTAPDDVAGRIADTAEGWRSWETDHDIYEGPHRDLVRLSSRVLKALTYRPTGAIVAAPTTSLPETVGGERNWDYRYAWIRDASLTLQALYIGACSDEVENFVSFMTSSAGGGAGDEQLAADHVRHRRRARPHASARSRTCAVGATRRRCGSATARGTQTQLDVYGELLDAIHLYHAQLGVLHPEIQRFVAELADAAASRWDEQDQGMWEMRGEPRHHLSSKVLCWTALDRAVKLAPTLGHHAKVEEWTAERDRIREAILTRGWSDAKQAYAQSFDSDDLDAAQLLMPLVGFLPATDERMRSTIEAIANELTQDGLVLRYLNNEGLQRRRPHRRGGHVHDLLLLARLGARQGRRARARRGVVRPAHRLRQRPRPARRGDRRRERRTARQLPAGVQPHRADHRGVGDRQGARPRYEVGSDREPGENGFGDLGQRIELRRRECVDERFPDMLDVTWCRALDCSTTRRSHDDQRAAVVGRTRHPPDQAAGLHAGDVMRDPTLLPSGGTADLGRSQPAARGLRQVDQHFVVRLREPGLSLQPAADPVSELALHEQELAPRACFSLAQPSRSGHSSTVPYLRE